MSSKAQKLCCVLLAISALTVTIIVACGPAFAQKKGEPGKFDFYLLDMPWGPEFCGIADVSANCKPQRSFIVHGLWPQNNDGSYPVFCSEEQGPSKPERNLDITPDLKLLAHEWAKHGTCSDLGPARFFASEHDAFSSIEIPIAFDHVDHEISMSPPEILELFYKANPQLPEESLIVSCHNGRLTAVEACFTKSLKPMSCLGLHSCGESSIKIEPLLKP